MTRAVILVDRQRRESEIAIAALKRAARQYAPSDDPIEVEVLTPTAIALNREPRESSVIYCPLTLDLPAELEFPARRIYQACRDVAGTRQWVEAKLDYHTGEGRFWLPVALTAKGPLYGEVIGLGDKTGSYRQPIHLTDDLRQPLYHLAYKLIDALNAPPAVYLLQFDQQGPEIIFDRLFPYPEVPAIASLAVQQPDLFTCHWLCLAGRPLLDLTIC